MTKALHSKDAGDKRKRTAMAEEVEVRRRDVEQVRSTHPLQASFLRRVKEGLHVKGGHFFVKCLGTHPSLY